MKTIKRVWAIRAGKRGEAHELFLDGSVIALVDAELGHLSKLEATRDVFISTYRRSHPQETRTGSAGIGGKYFRFAHEVVVGDLVVYPALSNRTLYVGEIIGPYTFIATSDLPHQRKVKWKYIIPKTNLSMPAQYELGAARTFFEFKKNVPELIQKILEGSVKPFTFKRK